MKNKWLKITPRTAGHFERIFGVPLKLYFDGILGFDLPKFEKLFNIPSNMSMQDYIKTMYGEEGVDIIRKLI